MWLFVLVCVCVCGREGVFWLQFSLNFSAGRISFSLNVAMIVNNATDSPVCFFVSVTHLV